MQPRGLYQSRLRLRQPRERGAMQGPDPRVPRAERDEGVEGGRAAAAHDDVVCVGFLRQGGETASRE